LPKKVKKRQHGCRIEDKVAVEAKATERVRKNDLKGLRALAEEIPLKWKIVVCMESSRWQENDGIEIIPISEFLKELDSETV
jgi:hypothetical protein